MRVAASCSFAAKNQAFLPTMYKLTVAPIYTNPTDLA